MLNRNTNSCTYTLLAQSRNATVEQVLMHVAPCETAVKVHECVTNVPKGTGGPWLAESFPGAHWQLLAGSLHCCWHSAQVSPCSEVPSGGTLTRHAVCAGAPGTRAVLHQTRAHRVNHSCPGTGVHSETWMMHHSLALPSTGRAGQPECDTATCYSSGPSSCTWHHLRGTLVVAEWSSQCSWAGQSDIAWVLLSGGLEHRRSLPIL